MLENTTLNPAQTAQTSSEKAPPHQVSPPTTRTRCPGCKKLFAVETEVLNMMARAGVLRAEFTCTGGLCRQAFAIELPVPVDVPVVPAVALGSYVLAEPEPIETKSEPKPDIQAPSVAAVPIPVVTSPAERECPRCDAKNPMLSQECVRCGIVFGQSFDDGETPVEELELGGTRELAQLWDRVMMDYEDRIRHDRFVNACRDSDSLSYAAKKYAQVLVSAPQDDIARLMRNRIVALVAAKAESSALPIRLNFRIPKLNSMALFFGSIMFFWGLLMPQLKNIMEIGLSVILLSIGVRLALRQKI